MPDGIFLRFELPENGVFVEAIFELFCCFRSEKRKYFRQNYAFVCL